MWPFVIGFYSFSLVSYYLCSYPCCSICHYFVPLMAGYYFIVWVYHILFIHQLMALGLYPLYGDQE